MKKLNLTDCLGFFGIFIWISTMFLRSKYFLDNEIICFYLGIAPNIGATWVFAYFSEKIFFRFQQKEPPFKFIFISLISILVLALISEVIHDLFLNSPFDIFDIIATTISMAIYAVIAKFNSNKIKLNIS